MSPVAQPALPPVRPCSVQVPAPWLMWRDARATQGSSWMVKLVSPFTNVATLTMATVTTAALVHPAILWVDKGFTKQCVCDPYTHQTHCHLDSCGSDKYCGLHNGVKSCVPHLQQTCMYTSHHIVNFDQHDQKACVDRGKTSKFMYRQMDTDSQSFMS
ncbi:hypothetical protein PAMP_002459 [Pampus punctatissimus]